MPRLLSWKFPFVVLLVTSLTGLAAETNTLRKLAPVVVAPRDRDDGENKDNLPLKLSWTNACFVVDEGRGEPASIGSYSVRAYKDDELIDFVHGVIRPRDGSIEKCWVTDLDGDGRPEIAVWIVNAGSGAYGTLEIFRFDGKKLARISVPELAARKKSSYHGHDTFEILDNDVVCSFPLYAGDEPENDPKGGKARFVLDLKKDQWVDY